MTLERFKQTRLLAVISTLPGKLNAKMERKLLNSFGANGFQVQKMAKFDVSDLAKWHLERYNQIYLSICRDRPPPPILTDGQTDIWTTDNSALEKFRYLSAGGAKIYNTKNKVHFLFYLNIHFIDKNIEHRLEMLIADRIPELSQSSLEIH